MDIEELTPSMKQYYRIKKRLTDEILFFQMGDFYETFGEDAEVASKVLGIALTSRNKNSANPIPMAGVPIKSADEYINKMLKAGYKVAIVDQVEEAKKNKKLVDRDLVRIVTPGTVTEDGSLDLNKNNYLISVFGTPEKMALASCDITTGDLSLTIFEGEGALDSMKDELVKLDPSEVLLPEDDEICDALPIEGVHRTLLGDENYIMDFAYDTLIDALGVASLDGYGIGKEDRGVLALGSLFVYLKKTYRKKMPYIHSLRVHRPTDYMFLDAETQLNLELVKPSRFWSETGGTLLDVLDDCNTPMGHRKLRNWILSPLLKVEKIEDRLAGVEELTVHPQQLERLRELLNEVSDLERLSMRVRLGSASARDMITISNSLDVMPEIVKVLNGLSSNILSNIAGDIVQSSGISEIIGEVLVDDPPHTMKEGGLIRKGYSDELDRLKAEVSGAIEWVANLQEVERERTGIKSLKVGFNKVFGYYIEVTKANTDMVPEDYIRKQTLVNSERYITTELKEKEVQILSAEEKINDLEYSLFCQLREEVGERTPDMKTTAEAVARLDCLLSLANVALLNDYHKPEFCEGEGLEIVDGRHPVVEKFYLKEGFVPNDCVIDPDEETLIIITGPNMSGKSTYLRQVALVSLMAQMGSFVPAREAKLPVIDRIFTRIGAFDELSEGRSTFLVEMNETAKILSCATDKSLILLDEVGRGTSTFDGVSLAWAICEYIHDGISAKTLFATHYHELALLPRILDKAKNLTVLVKEKEGEIIFLRKVIPGITDKSYGVQVAKLAGLPEDVLERAKEVLSILEGASLGFGTPLSQLLPDGAQLSFSSMSTNTDEEDHPIVDDLKNIDIDNISPLDALNLLSELKSELEDE